MVGLTNKREILREEVATLDLELSSLSSLAYIESEARSLGFVEMANPVGVISLPAESPVAIAKTF